MTRTLRNSSKAFTVVGHLFTDSDRISRKIVSGRTLFSVKYGPAGHYFTRTLFAMTVHVFHGYTYSRGTRVRRVHVIYGARIRPIHILDGQTYSTGTRSGAIWAYLGYPGHARKKVLSADVVWEYYKTIAEI